MQNDNDNTPEEIVILPTDLDGVEERNNLTLKELKEKEEYESKKQRKVNPDKGSRLFERKTFKKKQVPLKQNDPFKGIFYIFFFLIMSGSFYYMYIITNRLNNLDEDLFQIKISLDKSVSKNETTIDNLKLIQDSVNKLVLFQKSTEEANGKDNAATNWLLQSIDEINGKLSLVEGNTNNAGEHNELINKSNENVTNKYVEKLTTDKYSGNLSAQSDSNNISKETMDQLIDKGVAVKLAELEQKKKDEKAKLIEERNRKIAASMENMVKNIFEFLGNIYRKVY